MENVFTERSIALTRLFTAFTTSRGVHYQYPGESHDFWEMVYIQEGDAGITAGNRIFTCHGGALIFHKPNEFHRIWNAGTRDLTFTVVTFSADGAFLRQLEDTFIYLDEQRLPLMRRLEHFIAEHGPDDRYMAVGFREDPTAAAAFVSLLEHFLYVCITADTTVSPNTSESARLFADAVNILQDHIHCSLRVTELADALYISESRLKRLFRRYASIGVHEYFMTMKIDRSKVLLAQGRSVGTVAEAVGFSNQNYFSAAFKNHTGLSPTDWLKEH